MRLYYSAALAAIILLISGCSSQSGRVSVYDLKCENLAEPTGIATVTPALSWKIMSGNNGTVQKAYQVVAASRPELLSGEGADLWNSGKTVSPESVLVPWNGKELASRSVCYWKVRVWDNNDHPSEWSNQASFNVGLLDKSDWHASYIGLPGKENGSVSPQLRTKFDIKSKGEKTLLHVNSLGYHEVYLNGYKVGDKALTPAVSQFSKRSHVVTYDLTTLLKEGRNDLVLWLGHGWYTQGLPGVVSDRPLVRAQLEQLENGSWVTLAATDQSWQGRNSGYSRIGTWRSGDYGGENADGTLLLPDLTGASLDAVAWTQAYTVDDPGFEATPQTTELNSITDVINADTVYKAGEGKWIADLGTTLSGWSEIKFHSLKKGQEIKMIYSDHFDDDGTLYDQGQEDRYIAAGTEDEYFKNKFNYHGYRYVLISGLKEAPSKEDITGYLIHTNYKFASSFECSDPDLNRIHDMIFYTFRCLSTGGDLVDCPQIERLGYGGDGNASTLTAQTMFDLEPLYTNWLQAWADCIRDDGGMPHTAPNPYPAGGGPYWCGFIITASWKTYVNYGDIRILRKYYPVMQKWLGYVEKYSPGGLLEPWPDTDYRSWYLGDWAVPEGTSQTDKRSIAVVTNCFTAVCYETMEKIAGLLGKESDAAGYSKKAQTIRELINTRLYDTATGIYGSGSQIDLTYPLLAGVVPDIFKDSIRKKLEDVIMTTHSGHLACGLVGIPVFTEWAVKNEAADLMYTMLKKRDYPGYLYMIDNGATTTWEHWNGARSRIHNCYNGIGSWFYQAVAGISPDEKSPGYRSFVVNPQVPAGLTWARASKESPYGTIEIRWNKENEKFLIDLKVPAGCTARVAVPEGLKKVTADGKSKKPTDGFIVLTGGSHSVSWVQNL